MTQNLHDILCKEIGESKIFFLFKLFCIKQSMVYEI